MRSTVLTHCPGCMMEWEVVARQQGPPECPQCGEELLPTRLMSPANHLKNKIMRLMTASGYRSDYALAALIMCQQEVLDMSRVQPVEEEDDYEGEGCGADP